MIQQVLNEGFATDAMRFVADELDEVIRADEEGRSLRGPAATIDPDAARDAAELLRQALAAPAAPPPRRRARYAPADEHAYIPREVATSIVQSGIEELFYEHQPQHVRRETPRPAGDRRAAPLPPVTEERLDRVPVPAPDRRLLGAFEIAKPFFLSSPKWLTTYVTASVQRLLKDTHPFNPVPATPPALPERVRLVIVGDWGTGIPRARRVAEHMRTAMEQGERDGRRVEVVHLGDVYYTGRESEYRDRFLDPWPVRPGEEDRFGSWSLNGNHDMYAGGHAYFQTCLADARFARHAGSSIFRLETPDWLILGLDTAWREHRRNQLHEPGTLEQRQRRWVVQQVQGTAKKVLLLSHHQLFSARDEVGDGLKGELRDVLTGRGVDAWIWGHEHRCTVYGANAGVRFSACLGHGGVPVYVDRGEPPGPTPVVYESRTRFDDGLEPWGRLGFGILDLDGPAARLALVNELGRRQTGELAVA